MGKRLIVKYLRVEFIETYLVDVGPLDRGLDVGVRVSNDSGHPVLLEHVRFQITAPRVGPASQGEIPETLGPEEPVRIGDCEIKSWGDYVRFTVPHEDQATPVELKVWAEFRFESGDYRTEEAVVTITEMRPPVQPERTG